MSQVSVVDTHIDIYPKEAMSKLVTPELASIWRMQHHYSGQREFRQVHRDSLARMMRAGMFRQKTQISFMQVGDMYYLTNGQHTLSAIETSGCPQILSVVVTRGNSMEDVADDFSRHDTHLTRRFGDSLAAHGVHEEFGIPITQLHL